MTATKRELEPTAAAASGAARSAPSARERAKASRPVPRSRFDGAPYDVSVATFFSSPARDSVRARPLGAVDAGDGRMRGRASTYTTPPADGTLSRYCASAGPE